jgi:hypothetical protein
MARSVMVGEVRTGRRITHLPVSDARWTMTHRGTGTIEVDIPLNADDFNVLDRSVAALYPGPDVWPSPDTFPSAEVPSWTPGQGIRPGLLAAVEPARCFVAILEGDKVLEAGPIWAHSWDDDKGVLTVKAAGLRSLFDHRLVMGVIANGTAASTWETTYSNLSLGTIAKRLIELAMSHTAGNLPIVLPADEVSTHTRTYYGYEVPTVGDRLDQLMGVVDGPDIALEPRLTADRMGIEWVLRTGTEAQPLLFQAGPPWTWDMRVPHGGVGSLNVERDATGMASRAWVAGTGSQTSTLMEFADDSTLTSVGFPMLETVDKRGNVEDRATLLRWAQGDLAGSSRPWMSWKLRVQTNAPGSPKLGDWRMGDWARVWVSSSHRYLSLLLPAGFHDARIIQTSGGMGDFVDVTLAPVMERR